ncbi:hypothetical protein NFI96_018456 [Prochilodus magdalenae]|nr:hypothetical protein NFI96_018456 [Prochilodus magdalenae]
MVDPDAPSRTNPARSYWRHWLLVDIETVANNFIVCLWLIGPSSPAEEASGLQQAAASVWETLKVPYYLSMLAPHHLKRLGFTVTSSSSMSNPQTRSSHSMNKKRAHGVSTKNKPHTGNWNPQAFVQKFGLEGPVASLQFLTQNHND